MLKPVGAPTMVEMSNRMGRKSMRMVKMVKPTCAIKWLIGRGEMGETDGPPFAIRIESSPLTILPFYHFNHFNQFYHFSALIGSTIFHSYLFSALSALPFLPFVFRPYLFYRFSIVACCLFLPNLPLAYIAGCAIFPVGLSLAGLIVIADCVIL